MSTLILPDAPPPGRLRAFRTAEEIAANPLPKRGRIRDAHNAAMDREAIRAACVCFVMAVYYLAVPVSSWLGRAMA